VGGFGFSTNWEETARPIVLYLDDIRFEE